MKHVSLWVGIVVLGVGGIWLARNHTSRLQAELAQQRAAWDAEKAQLKAALKRSQSRGSTAVTIAESAPDSTTAALQVVTARPAPAELIAALQAIRYPSTGASATHARQVIYLLEELVNIGPTSVPAIRDFLARNEDAEFDTAWLQSKSAREGRLPGDLLQPTSLRLGLFDVLRRIGGADAEKVLADTLGTTGRGIEVAYLTRLLQEMAPNKYRDSALSSAHSLLQGATPTGTNSPLDRYHREYLFAVLTQFGDNTFVATAQAQLIQADGKTDRGALRYLHQSLGANAVPLAAQSYADPRVTDPSSKELFVRLALAYVGADPRANEFYQRAINDPILTKDHRSNLIEDLNEDGFADPKNLTASDLQLVQNRIALIELLAPSAMDQVNAAAFKEAYKDLLHMRAKITGVQQTKR